VIFVLVCAYDLDFWSKLAFMDIVLSVTYRKQKAERGTIPTRASNIFPLLFSASC
jgi:hypothetical protein